MKKKLLVVFFFSLILIIFIYKKLRKEDYYYLPIGDALSIGIDYKNDKTLSFVDYLENYLKERKKKVIVNKTFIYEDLRIKDLLNDNINPLLKEANLITISIGSEELFSKLKSSNEIIKTKEIYNYIDKMFNNYNDLLYQIRKLNKKEIFIIGYYNPLEIKKENEEAIKDIYEYIDSQFKLLESKYEVNYIEINEEFSKQKYLFLPNIDNSFPTKEAYYYIFDKIKRKLIL